MVVEVCGCPGEAQVLGDVVGIWAIYHPKEGLYAVALELINPLGVVKDNIDVIRYSIVAALFNLGWGE